MRSYISLFFDLDDTLYDFTGNSREVYHEVYDLLHYERIFASFEQYYAIYAPNNTRLWELYGNKQITKEELNRQRYLFPLQAIGHADEELAATFCRNALSRMPYKGRLLPHAKELLDYLKPKYRLFILSNGFHELQSRKMHSAGIDHYFEKIILSEDIGINKPHAGLFRYALESTQSLLADSVMIGDHFEVDIAGAASIGMDQIYYNHTGRTQTPFEPTLQITSLAQLSDIL